MIFVENSVLPVVGFSQCASTWETQSGTVIRRNGSGNGRALVSAPALNHGHQERAVRHLPTEDGDYDSCDPFPQLFGNHVILCS